MPMIVRFYDSRGKRIDCVPFNMSLNAFEGFCEHEMTRLPRSDVAILWRDAMPFTTYRRWKPLEGIFNKPKAPHGVPA